MAAPAPALDLPAVDVAVETGARAEGDAAVVIGVSDYLRVADLPQSAADARAIYATFTTTLGIPADRVRLLTSGASREAMEAAADWLGATVQPGGRAWFYFSGHGSASPFDGSARLLGDDVAATVDSIEARSVALEDVLGRAGSGGGRVVAVVDACFTGLGRDGAPLFPGLRPVLPAEIVVPRAETLVWTATSPGEAAGSLGGHGAFTWALLGALRGWADGVGGPADGSVSVAEASAWVDRTLGTLQVSQQHPRLEGALSRDLVLSPASQPSPALRAPGATAPSVVRELVPGLVIAPGEVSNAEWTALMGAPPVPDGLPAQPVQGVTWCDAVRYANRRSEVDGLRPAYRVTSCRGVDPVPGADGWRLPTAAEWGAIAAAVGPVDPRVFAASRGRGNLASAATSADPYRDFWGSLCEWVYGDGPFHACMGGSFNSDLAGLRNAVEFPNNESDDTVGFRLVRTSHPG